MRTIVCGAGQVGYNIASYLSRERNDVTIIDLKKDLIAQINDEMDATGIVGHASNPDALRAAGAEEADMIIAVTQNDEVNMVACQVAHSLFNVPKKVARIRQEGYLDPAWSNLFSRAHMPIDVIISPEREVARNIIDRLTVPGTTEVMPVLDGKAYVLSVMCDQNCSVINTPLGQLKNLFPDLDIKIVLINRQGELFMPTLTTHIEAHDEVTFIVSKDHMKRALSCFGHNEKEASKVLIIGGGNIGRQLSEAIHKKYKSINLKIVESDYARARELSEIFPEDLVLHGNALDRRVLEESGVDQMETVVTVTNDDEVNILSALLVKEYGCPRAITLVNKSVYSSLTSALRINAIVSPRLITASTIMRHVRRGRINSVFDIKEGFAELIEAKASDACRIINTPLEKLNLPEGMIIALIRRKDEIILPDKGTVILPNDMVVLFALRSAVPHVERLFSFKFDLL